MKFILTLVLMATFTSAVQAQKNNPEQVVQAQLEAYNARDIDAFMATFDDDASLWNFGETEPIAAGSEALRAIYQRVFEQSPNLHSTVINRTVIGSKVIDYEVIVGRVSGDNAPLHLVMIYEVKNGKIVKAVAVRNDPRTGARNPVLRLRQGYGACALLADVLPRNSYLSRFPTAEINCSEKLNISSKEIISFLISFLFSSNRAIYFLLPFK